MLRSEILWEHLKTVVKSKNQYGTPDSGKTDEDGLHYKFLLTRGF